MNQELALEIMLSGESVLLTGPAGSGKTYVLNQFIKLSRSEGKKVAVTATTGLAATHLNGTTIHSWSGIGVSDGVDHSFFERMPKGRKEIIEKTDVLIVDEISMLHDYRLDMVDEVCRTVRKRPDEPFGGIQIIMSGDFFQLPPINRGDARSGGFVVNSSVWRELDPVVCYLIDQYRQREDDKLLSILTAIRAGDVTEDDVEELMARVIDPGPDEEMTELHTVNVDVDSINEDKLKSIYGDEYTYSQTSTGGKNYVDNLKRSVLAPEKLRLKRDALVMAVKNATDRKYVNGNVGTVIDFEKDTNFPIVEFKNGKIVTMMPDTWELRDGDKKRASITQIPLRLAWAITIHKSQGMTLDAAKIDLRKAFVEGMGYVALSRVKNLFNLYLIGINNKALLVSPQALGMDELLRTKSANDAKKYSHLLARVGERAKKPVAAKKTTTGWTEKIEQMRKVHPNAFRPWAAPDDATLKQEFLNGQSVAKISKMLGRHEGSIIARLQKHFGEDVVHK